ncbi:hypothetical protein OAL27_03675 [Verrucomicrobiales bacterium]|nr:hypothetical protein [Verrucomicrobiales bacterium]
MAPSPKWWHLPSPPIDEIAGDAEIFGNFAHRFPKRREFDRLGLEFFRVSLSGFHVHSV